ncbi:leucine-rich PPR motif-containing protein, mitochondrial [Silurus asotus]|uniref:Leucine-rich PPR motif-containing protein, mitochondrial n=1 Tax=Silurus asotus TaxID=30991 RepID=A0AAD4ZZF5_SILAS|nr:leucine-rich PPR motif-containing protein, mitochondrial [Silurus asotus]
MAALLRSIRLLKLSHCSSLRGKINSQGHPIHRLYSGAVGVKGIEACPRQTALRSVCSNRSAWFSAGLRCFSVATESKGVVKDEPSVALRTKQAQQFDWALAKLDSSVRRTGRVTKTLIQRIFHDICRTGYPSSNQALLLLRSCGSLLPEMPFEERSELAHRIWEKLQELGAAYDVSHYNALLKVYLQNEYKFSPTDFLSKMEVANVQPNRVTYQRLIAAYCQNGDIEGASKILGFMKSKDLPITEAVFNSLVTGHSRAGDMESAENILSVMRGAGIEPGPDTYLALLVAYAEEGNMDKIKETLNTVQSKDVSLMDRDLMQVVFSLAKAGHQQYVPEIVECMRHERGYVPDAMNLCLSLTTQGFEDTAFIVLKSFPGLQSELQDGETLNMGNFFLRHCVNMNKSPEKLVYFCTQLKESNLHSSPQQFTLYCALESKNTALAIEVMKKMKEEGLPIRPHYFWPLLVKHQKDKNTQGTLEVLKAMQEMNIHLDVDTYSTYILPTFSSVDSARVALKDAGCAVDNGEFIAAEVRTVAASGTLSELYALLTLPSFPVISLSSFRGSLINGFRGSKDVENMAKITELLYKDSRFGQTDAERAENTAYFLFNLFDGMTESEVQAKEEILREYLNQLSNMNIFIHINIYRGIRNILNLYHVPELTKDVLALVDKQSRENDVAESKVFDGKLAVQEERLEELKSKGKPVGNLFKQLIAALCAEENLAHALELKAQYEDEMTTSCYALLINLCCRHDNPEEALNLKRELARKDSEVMLDANKYMSLVRVLSKHGRIEEAVDILKEMKEKNVRMLDTTVTRLFHILNNASLKGDVATIRHLQDTVFTLGLVKPTSNLCSPLVSAYLERGDVIGALEASIECQKQYNQMPRIHDIICHLVEKGETEPLQKAMDFVSQERGEMMMLYDLYFAFLQTGRYKEARKILETPGLRARAGRLQWFAERCIASQQMEPLENMVEMTAKLFECDRDEMYHYMLRLCKDTNDWQKAEAVWTKMQEENVIPRERSLRLLADILKSNNQEVPFDMPESWYEQPESGEHSEHVKEDSLKMENSTGFSITPARDTKPHDYYRSVLTLSKKGKVEEACKVVKEAHRKGLALGAGSYDILIKALLARGNLKDAMEIKDILEWSGGLSSQIKKIGNRGVEKEIDGWDCDLGGEERRTEGFFPRLIRSVTPETASICRAGCCRPIAMTISASKYIADFKLSEMANNLQIVTRVKQGDIKGALVSFKDMLQNEQVPSILAITRMVQGMGSHGDIQGIQEVESMVKDLGTSVNLSYMLYLNNKALAYIKNGDLDSAVEGLEALYTQNSDGPQKSIAFVFRKVLEANNGDALDKLSAMSERLCNQFAIYRPATDLFLQYIDTGRTEDAKFLLQRCAAVTEQKDLMVAYMTKVSQIPGQTAKIKNLLELVPDFERGNAFTFLLKCYSVDKDLTSAKALYQQMLDEGLQVNELSLKRLALLYKNAGEDVPFEEPPETFKFYADKLKASHTQSSTEN